jgi:hypothetical protein
VVTIPSWRDHCRRPAGTDLEQADRQETNMKIGRLAILFLSTSVTVPAHALVTARAQEQQYDNAGKLNAIKKTTTWRQKTRGGNVVYMKREVVHRASRQRGQTVIGEQIYSNTTSGSLGPNFTQKVVNTYTNANHTSRMESVEKDLRNGERVVHQKSRSKDHQGPGGHRSNIKATLAVKDVSGQTTFVMDDGYVYEPKPSHNSVALELKVPIR